MADNQREALGLRMDKPLDERTIGEFSSKVQGQLIRPQDESYDEARAAYALARYSRSADERRLRPVSMSSLMFSK